MVASDIACSCSTAATWPEGLAVPRAVKVAAWVGLLDQWAADAQRKGDERAARWQERQRERARTGQPTIMHRWAVHAQRMGDERATRWEKRQQEKALSGRVTLLERYASRAQRKGDEAAARWLEIDPLWQLIRSGPAKGPLGSAAVIRVYSTAWPWGVVVSGGGGAGAIVLAALLVVAATRRLIYRRSRSWTVLVRYGGHRGKMVVRVRSEQAAYRAAADVFTRFQAEGPAVLENWRADVEASESAPRVTPESAAR